jgi:hypothetical protein
MVAAMSDVTRNRVNWACGWVLGIGMFGAAVALDPLALYNPAMEGAFDSFSLAVTAGMAIVSLGGYTFFSRPYVAVRDGELVVQNPLRRWQLPLSEIEVVEDSYPYASVRIRDRRVWLMATERSARSVIVGDNSLTERINEHVDRGQGSMQIDTGERSLGRWTPLDRVQILIFALWLAYVIAASLRST